MAEQRALVTTNQGRSITFPSTEIEPDGASWIEVSNAADGALILRVSADEIAGDPRLLGSVARAASNNQRFDHAPDSSDADCFRVEVAHGFFLIPEDGSFIAFYNADGSEHLDGSAYWISDEIAEDPAGVLGAICGTIVCINRPQSLGRSTCQSA